MIDLFLLIEETSILEGKHEKGKGSKAGREAIHRSGGEEAHTTPGKSRVRVYNSITDALRNGYMGQPFSTKDADRLYVITHQKWGKDKEQIINGRSAKGFSGDVPFKRIKQYAVDTMLRHGGKKDVKKAKSK